MANLVFEKVNKIYDNGFHAVYDFDLEIREGEFIVFVGPSGCGKSTMLRTIAGLEEISKGKIFIDGELVNLKSPKERGIAMVFQSYALYPHMNVYDNLSFGLVLAGYDEDYIEKRVKETAAILGLEKMLDRFPRQLSGGQCQRVAVGRAIVRKPKVFLMDEPLSNLDAKQRASMRKEIIEIHKKTKATTIYVTHDQIEAMTMADRIVVMRDGYIQQAGTPKELYFHPINRFVAGFLGEPPMNFVSCSVKNGAVCIEDTDIALDLKQAFGSILSEYEGKKLTMGFRPESIRLAAADKGSVSISARTEVSEMLGDSVNVYASLGKKRVILRVKPEEIPPDDIQLSFSLEQQSIFLFDEETQRTLY